MRDELLAKVKARNDRFSALQDETEIIGDEAKSDAERLHVIAISIDGMQVGVDMQALYVLGWYHWFRYVSLPAGDDLRDLSEAGRLFSLLREHYPDVGPPMLDEILDRPIPVTSNEKAASIYTEVTGFIGRYQHGATLTELNRGINLLTRAARLMDDKEARITILDELARALRIRYEATDELASLDRLISTNQQILALSTPGTIEHAAHVGNLGNALQIRFDQNKNPSDIDSAVSLLREAAATTDNEAPQWLSALANALHRRSKATISDSKAADSDLEEAIRTGRDAVTETPPDAPELSRRMANLAGFYKSRYDKHGVPEDLDLAIEMTIHAATGTANPDPQGQRAAFGNLGLMLAMRFEETGNNDDLDAAVQALDRALPGLNPRDSAAILAQLGFTLDSRAHIMDDRGDLDRAITAMREALALTSRTHHAYAAQAEALGSMLWTRIERYGVATDLDESITYYRAAVDHAQLGDEDDRPMRLIYLSTALRERGRRTLNLQEMDEAIDLSLRAVKAIVEPGNKAMALSDLGHTYVMRHEVSGELADLNAAVEHGDRSVAICPDGHRLQKVILSHAGSNYKARYDLLDQLADLEAAILLARESVVSTDNAVQLANLAGVLSLRFRRLGRAADLVESIDIGQRAIERTPSDHPNRASFLHNLASAVHHYWEETGESSALDQAISSYQDAVAAMSGNPFEIVARAQLADALADRFDISGAPEDLDSAVNAAGKAATLTGPYRPRALAVVGAILRKRYAETGQDEDINRSIEACQQAIDLTPSDTPAHAVYLLGHGCAHRDRYDSLRDPADLNTALDSWSKAAESPDGPPTTRMSAALHVGTVLMQSKNHDQAYPYFALANDMLPLVAWRGLDRQVQESRLARWTGLAADSAAAAIAADHPQDALTMLEHGRSILWGQKLQLQADFTALAEVDEDLAARLAAVRDELDASMSGMPELDIPVRESLLSSGVLPAGSIVQFAQADL
jgi:tetratricopeptide (TPR) repeat protein